MSVRFQERQKARGSSPRTAPGFFVSASTKKRPEGRFFSMRYNTAETLDALEHQRGISAAEAEVVGEFEEVYADGHDADTQGDDNVSADDLQGLFPRADLHLTVSFRRPRGTLFSHEGPFLCPLLVLL